MKEYLIEFFKRFDYDESDSKILLATYDKIVDSPEAFKIWNNIISTYEKDFMCDKSLLIADADSVALKIDEPEYTLELLMLICMTKHLEYLYNERNISQLYFEKSVLDLKYKLEECKLVYGIVGTFVSLWLIKFFELKLFGIGRLQFEIVALGEEYAKNGIHLYKDSKVINVHIPRSGEKLTEEACYESYHLAKEFFMKDIQMDPCPFMCSSWLLYPEHEQILPKESNIYKFFKSFDIISSKVDKSRYDLWRLFDTFEMNPDKLPNDSSVRRAYINHLKKGGNVGTGKGILFV